MLKELKTKVETELENQFMTGRALLDRFCVIDEDSRKASAYADPRYAPFFYHLGKLLTPKKMIEIGLDLGFASGCFLKSCKTVEKFFAFQGKTDDFYSPRLAVKNVKMNYKGELITSTGYIIDESVINLISNDSWDLVFLNERWDYDKYLNALEIMWPHIALGGMVVWDYTTSHEAAGKAFLNFCKIKNADSIKVETRHGVGIIQK
jgi:predicted O-methyltransferase YrrM